MSNSRSRWNTAANAEAYETYARSFPMYKATSSDLVSCVSWRKGMRVLDLAAGTGMLSRTILENVSVSIDLTLVEQAEEMLRVAERNLSSHQCTFLVAPAEDLAQHYQVEFDAVLCNAAFWQLRMNDTFKAVAHVLKPGGRFVFNLPDQVFADPAIEKQPTTPYPHSREAIIASAESNNLVFQDFHIETYTKTAAEALAFQDIPVMQGTGRDSVVQQERRQALQHKLRVGETWEQQWAYFVFTAA